MKGHLNHMSTNSKERLRQLLAQHKTSQHTSIDPEPVAEPTVEHVAESVEIVVEPVEVAAEPVVESVESAVEPATELVTEPVTELVTEPITEPEPVAEPEPVTEPVEPVIEPVTEPDAPIDLTETRVLSKDEIKESLDHISQLTAKLESFKGSSEPVLDSSNVDLAEPVPSVETVDVSETTLSRSEDAVSGRDEFVEGMVEGLPDFKSDAVPEAVSSEVEDTLEDASSDIVEDDSDDKAELIDGETLIDSSDLPTFDDQEPALVKKPKFVERAIAVAKRKPGLIVTVCGIALVAALIGVAAMTPSSKKSTPSSSANAKVVKSLAKSSSTSSSKKSLSIEEQLTATAKGMDAPYKVEVEDLVGGYKLGKITYYPDNEAKRYTDASLHAPEKAEATDTSDTAKSITDELSKDLPTINSTIKVKDKDKVSFETYAKDDGYITILLYNKKPFGYVTTDKDGYKTNHVTTFYVSDVAADA